MKKGYCGVTALVLFLNGLVLYQFVVIVWGEGESMGGLATRLGCSLCAGFLISTVTMSRINNRLEARRERDFQVPDEEERTNLLFFLFISTGVCFMFGGIVVFGTHFGKVVTSACQLPEFSSYIEGLIERVRGVGG